MTARDWTLTRLALLFAGLLATLGCPGFGSNEPESVLADTSAPLCEQAMVVLDARCNSCHGSPRQLGAPGYFRSDVFLDVDGVQGAVAQADRLLARSEDGTMPPANTLTGMLTDEELQVLRDWHAAGAPSAPCDGTMPADAGMDAGATDAALDTGASDAGATDAGATDAGTSDAAMDTADDAPEADADAPCPDCLTLQNVIDDVFEPSCSTSGCHDVVSFGGGLSLEGDDLMDVLLAPSFQLPAMARVDPGDPTRSYLWRKSIGNHTLAGGVGTIMPPGGGLTQDQLDTLETWILEGARP